MAPPTVAGTLAYARADLGRTEQPPRSNRFVCHDGVDLWAWYDPRLQRNPWCAAWASRCWAATGDPFPIQTENGFHYTPTGLAWFRRRGLVVPKSEARPGDLAFFQFDDDPQVDHVGIVESIGDGHLVTIEGNTSPGWSGSQSNGGGVFRRKRWSSIAAVCRPPYAPPSAVQPTREVTGMRLVTRLVTVTHLDDQGCGWVLVPETTAEIVSLIPHGSNPPKDGYWNPPEIAMQDYTDGAGNNTLISFTDAAARAAGTFFLKKLVT